MGLQGGAWHGTSGNATANKTHGQSMHAICGQIGGVEVVLSTMARDARRPSAFRGSRLCWRQWRELQHGRLVELG